MRLLVIHQNFPGQFGHLVKAWVRTGWDVLALGRESAPGIPGFKRLLRYRVARKPRDTQHQYLRQMEVATLNGQAVARVLLDLKRRGYRPDAILAHPGWGETLFVKDVFPDARLVHYCEWFYGNEGADLGYDPEFPSTFDDKARIRTWNALHLLNLHNCDVGISPTKWQLSQHPKAFHPKMVVAHEGVNTELLRPDPAAALELRRGTVFRAGDPVVTYVARNLEPYRGFHTFMRALEVMQRKDRRVRALIVGGEATSYGRKPEGARTWREKLSKEVSLDPARTHFAGKLAYPDYVAALQVSAAHTYLTYPFVLSWSLLEAMACRANIVAAHVAPVREFATDGIEAHLVDGLDPAAVATKALACLGGARTSLSRTGQGADSIPSVSQAVSKYGRILCNDLAARAREQQVASDVHDGAHGSAVRSNAARMTSRGAGEQLREGSVQ